MPAALVPAMKWRPTLTACWGLVCVKGTSLVSMDVAWCVVAIAEAWMRQGMWGGAPFRAHMVACVPGCGAPVYTCVYSDWDAT